MSRVINTIQEYTQQLKVVFQNIDLCNYIHDDNISSVVQSDNLGIIHLTDLHFNQIIQNILDNKYDFKVAAKRLKKLITKAIIYFKATNVDTILLAMTGDLMNSDRRLDQLLSQSTNRSKATFLAVNILSNIIVQLSYYFNTINIANVSGNQSRISKDIG